MEKIDKIKIKDAWHSPFQVTPVMWPFQLQIIGDRSRGCLLYRMVLGW